MHLRTKNRSAGMIAAGDAGTFRHERDAASAMVRLLSGFEFAERGREAVESRSQTSTDSAERPYVRYIVVGRHLPWVGVPAQRVPSGVALLWSGFRPPRLQERLSAAQIGVSPCGYRRRRPCLLRCVGHRTDLAVAKVRMVSFVIARHDECSRRKIPKFAGVPSGQLGRLFSRFGAYITSCHLDPTARTPRVPN
jgi:hypothetical protein